MLKGGKIQIFFFLTLNSVSYRKYVNFQRHQLLTDSIRFAIRLAKLLHFSHEI